MGLTPYSVLAADDDWIPSFDGLVKVLLQQLGVSPIIIGLVGLAFGLKSWVDAARDGQRLAGRVTTSAQQGVAHLRATSPAFGLITIVAVLTAQGLAILLCYVYGNFLSIQFQILTAGDDIGRLNPAAPYFQRYQVIELAWQKSGLLGILSLDIYPALELDGISVAALCIALAALYVSYKEASRSSSVSAGMGFLAAFPISLYFFFAVIGFAFTLANFLIFGSGKNHSQVELNFLLGLTLVCGGYYGTWIAAAKGSRFAVNAWRGPT